MEKSIFDKIQYMLEAHYPIFDNIGDLVPPVAVFWYR